MASDDTPTHLPSPIRIRVDRVVLLGTALFVLWAAVAWAVPTLHDGARSWWPMIGVYGAGLGVLMWLYLRRGRGNAAGVLKRD